jgi:hypothetical protein
MGVLGATSAGGHRSPRVILLWGVPGDEPLALVRARLRQRGADVTFLDQRRVTDTRIDLAAGVEVTGRITTDETSIDLQSITAAYIRPYDIDRLPPVRAAGIGSDAWRSAAVAEDLLVTWAELSPALVVNRPSAMGPNNSKPLQASLIRQAGFRVPETLVTTDIVALAAFQEEHGAVIYKSLSGVRSIVSRLGPEHRGRLGDLEGCPTQFQEFVPGTDVRVHVVSEQIFSCEVRSEADDYRYASRVGEPIGMRAIELPDEIADRCRTMVRDMGLRLAGIDFRRTLDGEFVGLEVNPSPGFSFYELGTGQPIADAVASLLMS